MISIGVDTVTPCYIAFDTVLNRMIATASFTIPSPNIKENSFGCSSYLMIEIAAITSDEHNREAMTKQSLTSSLITSFMSLQKIMHSILTVQLDFRNTS